MKSFIVNNDAIHVKDYGLHSIESAPAKKFVPISLMETFGAFSGLLVWVVLYLIIDLIVKSENADFMRNFELRSNFERDPVYEP